MTVKNKTTGKARYFLTIKELEGIVNNLVALFQLDSPWHCSSAVTNLIC